jgi:hypothetical protein
MRRILIPTTARPHHRTRLNQILELNQFWTITGVLAQRGSLLNLTLLLNKIVRSLTPVTSTQTLITPNALIIELWRLSDLGGQCLRNQPRLPGPTPSLGQMAGGIELTYRVKLRGLSRKLRKIVRNRYRFTRSYEWVHPTLRYKAGLHLIKPALRLKKLPTFSGRLSSTVYDVLNNPRQSATLALKQKHQQVAMSMLKPVVGRG